MGWQVNLGIGIVAMSLIVTPTHAALVWQSTFDGDADGVVNVVDGNPDKALIGPAVNGYLQINTADKTGAHNANDRGGRALGTTLNGNDSFSGLYTFHFSDLNEDATQMWESVGFIGDAANITHQKIGVMLRHWKVSDNYYMSMDMVFGGSGTGTGHGAFLFDATGANGSGAFAPNAILLGNAAEYRPLKLAIGYDGDTNILSAGLYTDTGTKLSGNFVDLNAALSPSGSNTVQGMLDGLAVTHLGWGEYVATGAGRTTTWQVDSLAYYDDATDAFDAAGAPPAPTFHPQVFEGMRVAGRSILVNDDGSWTHIRVQNVGGQFQLGKQTSTDNGLSWSAFSHVVNLPSNDFGTVMSAEYDNDGEIQVHVLKPRGSGTPAETFFLDMYQMNSTNGGTQWTAPQLVFEGYVPDMQQSVVLASGRILLPFSTFITGASEGPPTGNAKSLVMFSDDGGGTWQISSSNLTTPVPPNFNGNSTGAVEPVIMDQPALNRQVMYIRTQADYLYESISTDDGTTWSTPTQSIFASSDSPADYQWLPDGRVVMFWNNTRNLPRLPNGQGVYSGRDALHAAISEDGGLTWQGFREIYLDPTRHDTPPITGDRGTGYPFALLMNDGRVAVMTGQGPAAAMIHFNPDWLYEKTRYSDFSNGLDGWSAFTSVGPASGFWRDRVIGPEVIAHPDEAGEFVLRLNNPNPLSRDGDGAVWNFTMGTRGRVALRMLITDNTQVADIQLTDRFLDPADDTSMDVAIFNVRFNSRGELVGQEDVVLSPNQWHVVAIEWDLELEQALLSIDGQVVSTLDMLYETQTGVSYLRLRSPFVQALDPDGWLVDWVSVQVPEPGTALMLVATWAAVRRRNRRHTGATAA